MAAMLKILSFGVYIFFVSPAYGSESDDVGFCDSEAQSIYNRYGLSFKEKLLNADPGERVGYAVSEINYIEGRFEKFYSLCLFKVKVDYGLFSEEYMDVDRFTSNVKLAISLFKDMDEVGAARVVGEYCALVSRGLKRDAVCQD